MVTFGFSFLLAVAGDNEMDKPQEAPELEAKDPGTVGQDQPEEWSDTDEEEIWEECSELGSDEGIK